MDTTKIKVTEPLGSSTLFTFDLPGELRAKSGAELHEGTPLHDKLLQEVSGRIAELSNVLRGSVTIDPTHVRVLMIDVSATEVRSQTIQSIKSILSAY